MRHYLRTDFGSDLIAGVITATLLVPQAMAYSQLAGLPPEIGLYASMAPPVLYALVGSSRTMAVGPVAVASLMLAAALAARWPPGSPEYLGGAVVVSGLVGLMLLIMGAARLGVVANFLSHPVLSGFTNAAALVILVSQLPPLLGMSGPLGSIRDLLAGRGDGLDGLHGPTALLGALAVCALIGVSRFGGRLLRQLGVQGDRADVVVRPFP